MVNFLTGYVLRKKDIAFPLRLAPVGLKLFQRKRLAIRPHRIKGTAQIKAMLDKSRATEAGK